MEEMKAGPRRRGRRICSITIDESPQVYTIYKTGVRRDLRVDNVRGVLIILVVIGHFLLPLYQTRLVNNLTYLIYSFHMPCFIMISGFYSKSLYKNGRFRWGKVVQLLWLYFIFKMLVNITEGLLAGYIPVFPDFLRESGAPWYLMSLGIWYLTVSQAKKFREYPLNFLFIGAVMLFCIFIKYFVSPGSFLSLDRTIAFAPFFYIGYFYSQENLDVYLASNGRKLIDTVGICCVLVIFFLMYDKLMIYNLVVYGADYIRYHESVYNEAWLINLIWYLGAFCMSMTLIGIMLNRKMFILTGLGQRTLQVYILHRPIRDLCQYFGLYELITPGSKVGLLLIIVFSVLLTLVLGTESVNRIFTPLKAAPDSLLKKLGGL